MLLLYIVAFQDETLVYTIVNAILHHGHLPVNHVACSYTRSSRYVCGLIKDLLIVCLIHVMALSLIYQTAIGKVYRSKNIFLYKVNDTP